MLDIKKHRQVLFELISDIYRSPIAMFLGFKGGTMAYFFYGLDRFSVDLDFDLLEPNAKETVRETMRKLLLRYGALKEDSDKRYTIFFLLSYEKGLRTVKIEISKRKTDGVHYTLANFYGVDVFILNQADSFATKLLAATGRNRIAFRDFYDIYFYLKKGVQPNIKLVERIAKKSFAEYVDHLIKFMEKNVSSRNILHGVGELVNEGQKRWIKANLKKEITRQLNLLVDELKKRPVVS